ncbi:MAG: hypothetical protein KJZ80_13405 [Hyphomicrobiaceae bacterium]|nr:hypothetical protein [Hyphomicrobiaceae bacterium]
MERGRTDPTSASPGAADGNDLISTSAPDRDRRQVLAALAKFSAAVAPMTYVLLDAESAKAKQSCSDHPEPQPGVNCDP